MRVGFLRTARVLQFTVKNLSLIGEGQYLTRVSNPHSTMADTKNTVDQKIAGKKVMVFSKSYCPYCTKAKRALEKYVGNIVSPDDYEVWEIENLPNCDAIQDYLQKLTGQRSVPRVFINQKFVGGGDDVVVKDKSGELKRLLA